MREVKEQVKLNNLRLKHVTIQSELRYLIGAKVAGTVKWNRGLGSTWPKTEGLCPVQVTTRCQLPGSGCLAVPDPDWGVWFSSNPDQSQVTWNRC
jgi:hypothetical protein